MTPEQPCILNSSTDDVSAQLANASSADPPVVRAALLLADAWGPALSRSYELGYENGYAVGHAAAEGEMAGARGAMACRVRELLKVATYVERTARTDEPCERQCERCSRCVRAYAVAKNMRRYGTPDFPGASERAA